MKKITMSLVQLALACLLVMTQEGAAQAQTETYRARLSPMPVTPQTVDDITGEGEAILRLEGRRLTLSGTFSGMSSRAVAAHIHNGPPAQPGPVLFQLALSEDDAGGSLSGEMTLSDEQLAMLQANALYVQVHSENNPGGELRGWIFLLSHFENL